MTSFNQTYYLTLDIILIFKLFYFFQVSCYLFKRFAHMTKNKIAILTSPF